MMKKETVEKWITRIERDLSRIEVGSYSDLTLEQITDRIAWLAKFKYIDSEKCAELADRVIEINHYRGAHAR